MDKKRTKFNITGVGQINSIEEMAEKAGVSVNTILKRRGVGANDDEIFNGITPFIRVFNEKFYNLLDVKRHYRLKMKLSTISWKLKKGASIEEIIQEPLIGREPDYYIKRKDTVRARQVTLEGITYSSITKAMEFYKSNHYRGDKRVTANHGTIEKRLQAGWSDEKAFFTPTLKRSNR